MKNVFLVLQYGASGGLVRLAAQPEYNYPVG